jgi:glycine oxidase
VEKDNDKRYDAVFVGAGVIGLASAWSCARRGLSVCVLDRDHPAAGATGVAAGMLAPVGEASWGEERLLSLNQESLGRWPRFAEALQADAGAEVDFAARGALHVALDRDEAEELRRRYELHRRFGLDSEWMRGSECRALEPGLTTAVRGGAHVPGEASVDPRRLVAALLSALERLGANVVSGADVVAADRLTGAWRLGTADGRTFESGAVVLAAGSWSGQSGWLPEEARPPIRPVKGEILTLRGSAADPVCERIIVGERVYLVPGPTAG